VVLCAALAVAVVGAKKPAQQTTVPAIDREDIMQRLDVPRAPGNALLNKAESSLAHAQGLIADGEFAAASGILNKLVRMDLPADPSSDKVFAHAYQLLGDTYTNLFTEEAAAGKIADLYTRSQQYAGLQEFPASEPFGAMTRDAGDDTCDASVPVTLDHSEIMTVAFPGDHNWRSYTISSPSIVRHETISTDTFGDDTDLNLWGGCDAGTPTDFIAFDDDGGPGFLSLIEECIDAGTYYLEVGGFADSSTPDDFELAITVVDSCVIPSADEYEPDNESSQANSIGFRNNGVGEGNQFGRDNKNVQEHSIFGAGDIDFVEFGLSRANRVQITTFGDGADTVIGMSNSGGQLLAVDDDGGPGLGSALNFCLPGGSDWFVAIIGFSASATFPYNIAVDVEFPCNFEDEPNGVCGQANPIEAGEVYSGLQTAAGVAENDWWVLTVDETTFVTIETDGWDDFAVDTFLELWGPATEDTCPGVLIAADDDAGPGFLSKIDALLEPGDYYINATVSPFSVGANYPYDLMVSMSEPPLVEMEPNNNCGEANAAMLGDNFLASISPVGDRDHFLLSVPVDGFVEIETDGPSGDTVLQIESADGSTVIGCDDDAGFGLFSLWGCCLAAGDYCVVVRDFGDNSTISTYNIDFRDLGACTPSGVCPVAGLGCPF
jgi:hypothetical protein